MRIIETTIADKIEHVPGLLEAHWHESARNKHLMVLKPDVARYQALERPARCSRWWPTSTRPSSATR
jgi:hypothetical protein